MSLKEKKKYLNIRGAIHLARVSAPLTPFFVKKKKVMNKRTVIIFI
jgi:hypothetical protein